MRHHSAVLLRRRHSSSTAPCRAGSTSWAQATKATASISVGSTVVARWAASADAWKWNSLFSAADSASHTCGSSGRFRVRACMRAAASFRSGGSMMVGSSASSSSRSESTSVCRMRRAAMK